MRLEGQGWRPSVSVAPSSGAWTCCLLLERHSRWRVVAHCRSGQLHRACGQWRWSASRADPYGHRTRWNGFDGPAARASRWRCFSRRAVCGDHLGHCRWRACHRLLGCCSRCDPSPSHRDGRVLPGRASCCHLWRVPGWTVSRCPVSLEYVHDSRSGRQYYRGACALPLPALLELTRGHQPCGRDQGCWRHGLTRPAAYRRPRHGLFPAAHHRACRLHCAAR